MSGFELLLALIGSEFKTMQNLSWSFFGKMNKNASVNCKLWYTNNYIQTFETKYSRVDQETFVEDSLKKNLRDAVCLIRPYPTISLQIL